MNCEICGHQNDANADVCFVCGYAFRDGVYQLHKVQNESIATHQTKRLSSEVTAKEKKILAPGVKLKYVVIKVTLLISFMIAALIFNAFWSAGTVETGWLANLIMGPFIALIYAGLFIISLILIFEGINFYLGAIFFITFFFLMIVSSFKGADYVNRVYYLPKANALKQSKPYDLGEGKFLYYKSAEDSVFKLSFPFHGKKEISRQQLILLGKAWLERQGLEVKYAHFDISDPSYKKDNYAFALFKPGKFQICFNVIKGPPGFKYKGAVISPEYTNHFTFDLDLYAPSGW